MCGSAPVERGPDAPGIFLIDGDECCLISLSYEKRRLRSADSPAATDGAFFCLRVWFL